MRRVVKDVMTKTVLTVGPDASFKEIVRLMAEHRVSALPVVEPTGRPVGIVSEADLLLKEERERAFEEHPRFVERRRRRVERTKAEATSAGKLMTTPVITVGPLAVVGEAARIMHREGVKRLPVVGAPGRLLGIVSRRDLLRVFLRDDAEIRREVVDVVIERTLWIDPQTLGVSVHEGVVTLRGELERRSLCSILLGLVRAVDGVVGVTNLLTYRFDDADVRPEPSPSWAVLPRSLGA